MGMKNHGNAYFSRKTMGMLFEIFEKPWEYILTPQNMGFKIRFDALNTAIAS